MKIVWGFLGLITLAAIGFVGVLQTSPSPITHVDVSRYMGFWYAIAHIPTSFERACAQGTTAHYQLLPNGRVVVTNTCYREDGTPSRVVGEAWIPNPAEPGKLKVSFVKFLGLQFRLFQGVDDDGKLPQVDPGDVVHGLPHKEAVANGQDSRRLRRITFLHVSRSRQ